MAFTLRLATLEDRPELQKLIERSARGLSAGDYTPQQVELALLGAYGVDSTLIRDGTYFVAESEGALVGCGGWSRRRTMYGGDALGARDAVELDPATDAARIRAFFIDPAHARQGIARAILHRCEAEARAHGFKRLDLMATLPGVRLYRAEGYLPGEAGEYPVAEGVTMRFVPMSKVLE
jgi:GNAT superfamily N-acetyltransferase